MHTVRWLSISKSAHTIFCTTDALLIYFALRDASKDSTAKGFTNKTASKQFVYITYFLVDVLSVVNKFSLTFQHKDLDLAAAKGDLGLCLGDLDVLHDDVAPYSIQISNLERDNLSGLLEGENSLSLHNQKKTPWIENQVYSRSNWQHSCPFSADESFCLFCISNVAIVLGAQVWCGGMGQQGARIAPRQLQRRMQT